MHHCWLGLATLVLAACAETGPGRPPGFCRPAELVAARLILGGEDFTGSVTYSHMTHDIQPVLHIELDPASAGRLAAISEAHLDKPLPILVDGVEVSRPIVSTPLLTGEFELTGLPSSEAERIARALAPPCASAG